MATELLPIGPPTTLVVNQIYALPAVAVTLFAAGTPTITQGNVVDTVATAVTLTNNQATLAGGFLKCTSAAVITLKRV